MDYIRFIVDGQRLDYSQKYYSSTDTINTIQCNFKFETDDLGHVRGGWNLPYVWAQFHDEQGNVYVKEVTADNTCSIPYDCLRQRKFKMTLFATDTEDYMTCKKRYTTNEITFRFNGLANINYDGGGSPDEPMPTNWQILLDRVDTCESSVDGLSQNVATMGDKVDTLSQNISTMGDRVDDLDDRVTSNTNAIDGINATVDGLSTRLADESTARANADTNLQSLINAESTARANADARLEGLIGDRYTKAETDDLLDAESTAREAADTNLQSLITAESTARTDADTRLEGLIDDEKTARESADADLRLLINDEVNERASGEKALQQSVNSLDDRVTDNTNDIENINATVDDLSDTVTLLYKTLKKDNSWIELVSLMRSGKASQYLGYRDQIEEDWIDVDNGNKAYSNVWDIAKFGTAETREGPINGMFLKQHWATLKAIQFSHNRAFYACRDGLSAGTYHITLGSDWGKNAKKDKSYQFTITNDVPEGGKLAGFYSMPDVDPSNWKVYVYAENGIDILENAIAVTEGTDGVDLGVMPYNTRSGQMNSMQETGYGNNDWELSAYRQYLNSRKGKGEWWIAQDEWDIAPDQLKTVSGFLCGISDELYNSMQTVKVKTWKNNPTHGGVESYTYDKVFLPSKEELYYNPQKAGEGSYYPLMKEQLGLDSPLADYTNYAPNITYAIENHNSAQIVCLRSANLNYANVVWIANASGNVHYSYASNANRCTPVCVIG